MKWINALGIFFAIAGGLLLGIGITSLQTMPDRWLMISLLFICMGSFVALWGEDGKHESK